VPAAKLETIIAITSASLMRLAGLFEFLSGINSYALP
jgi:hypothetical protein